MERRAFLKTGIGVSAGVALGLAPRVRAAGAQDGTRWRKFEVVTRVEVANPTGVTRAWVPVPLLTDTDYFKRQGDTWTGNAAARRGRSRTPSTTSASCTPSGRRARSAPVVEVTSRFSTRDRAVDLGKPPAPPAREDTAVLKRYLEPTQLIPTDGIVLETARGITQGAQARTSTRPAPSTSGSSRTRSATRRSAAAASATSRPCSRPATSAASAPTSTRSSSGSRAPVGLPARDVYGVRVRGLRRVQEPGQERRHQQGPALPRRVLRVGAIGWVPVDPADVRKVVLEEKPAASRSTIPVVAAGPRQAVRRSGR